MTAITVYNSGTEVRRAKPDPEEKDRAPTPALPSTGGKHPRGARRIKAKALCACEIAAGDTTATLVAPLPSPAGKEPGENGPEDGSTWTVRAT